MLSGLLTNPYIINNNDLQHLKNATERYPSFALGYTLIAKTLHTESPESAAVSIKKAAIYALNRNALRKFIEEERLIAETIKVKDNDVVIEEELYREGRENELLQEIARPEHISRQEAQLLIIDKFIQAEPRISPVKSSNNIEEIEDLSIESTLLKERLLTESFAKVLVSQGHFLKAKEVYNELCLIKPEKKVYFAEKIEELNKKNLKI